MTLFCFPLVNKSTKVKNGNMITSHVHIKQIQIPSHTSTNCLRQKALIFEFFEKGTSIAGSIPPEMTGCYLKEHETVDRLCN